MTLCENCKYKGVNIKQTFLVTLDIFNRHNENNALQWFRNIQTPHFNFTTLHCIGILNSDHGF